MNFNTQICTTVEQSERLLALGVKKETADCRWIGLIKDAKGKDIPKKKQIWSIRASESEDAMSCGFMRYSFVPAWSLHRLVAIYCNGLNSCQYDLVDLSFEGIIVHIEAAIKVEQFNKDYLKEKKK